MQGFLVSCVCVRACVHACVRACVRVCVHESVRVKKLVLPSFK